MLVGGGVRKSNLRNAYRFKYFKNIRKSSSIGSPFSLISAHGSIGAAAASAAVISCTDVSFAVARKYEILRTGRSKLLPTCFCRRNTTAAVVVAEYECEKPRK